MNEQMNCPAKWLKYLMYVAIAALVNSVISYIPLVGKLSGWLGIAISAAAVYLLFRLKDAGKRYRTAALFAAISLVAGRFSGTIPVLIVLVCSTVSEYQEYHGHGELVADRNARLADKWNGLFWLSLVASLIVGVAAGLLGAILLIVTGTESELSNILVSALSTVIALAVRMLYVVYLHRTVKLMENEIVM